MSPESGPSIEILRQVEALYGAVARDGLFERVRRLMEVDWSEADTTVEDLGLPALVQRQARKLQSALDAPAAGRDALADLADAIRYSERHDRLAQDTLWWLRLLASDPILRAS